MKINEIATKRLDEAPPGVTPAVKYIGPYFDDAAKAAAKAFGVGKGTTQAELDALRAGETGAAKSGAAAADRQLSTVSKDELNALLYPPAETNPTVASWIKNRQSDAGPAVWRRRGDPGFDPDLSKNKALPPGGQAYPEMIAEPLPSWLLPKGAKGSKTPGSQQSSSGPKPRPRPAEPELGNIEPPLQAGPAAAEIGQVRPGVDAKASAAGSTAAGAQRYTMDEIRQFQELLSTNPAAAQEQAKKMGWLGKAGWTAAGAAALGLGVQGAHMAFPDKVPSVGQMVDKAFTKAATIGADPNGAGPPPGERKYDFKTNDPSNDSKSDSSNSTVTNTEKLPPASNNDDLKNDPEYQELLRKALAGEKMNESTAALNRMVYLSRL